MRWCQGKYRAGDPVLLLDQLVAWNSYANGDSVSTIAARLYRNPRETRAILWGASS
jgi:hypothetical protein